LICVKITIAIFEMKKNKLEKYLSRLNGSNGSYPFGPEALVFKVMRKMFALISQNEQAPRVTLKCAPANAEVLVSEFESIIPGYYMNKKHWVTISLTDEVSDEMITDLASGSYKLVVSQLTKADRNKLEQQ
jgi:predicted DNA-binding protein (MmcQ/YjbR family)